RLASIDELGGDKEAARTALAAAARAHEAAEAKRATALWERVLVLAPDDPAAAEALCARYEAESRWEELAQILARRLAKSEAPAEQASLCAALGRVMLESQGDAARAVELLERAVHLDEQRADAWTQLARALDAAGQPQRALAAADQAIKLGTGEASAQ